MHLIKNEKGAAMPLALMVMVVLAMLGTTLWHLSMSETLMVEREQSRTQAHYMATAGAEVLGQYVMRNPDRLNREELEDLLKKLDGKTSGPVTIDTEFLGLAGTFTVAVNIVEKDEDGDLVQLIELTSVGNTDDVTQSIRLYLVKGDPFDAALQVNNSVDLSGMTGISGDIISSGDVNIKSSLECTGNPGYYCNTDAALDSGPFKIEEHAPFPYESEPFDPRSDSSSFEDKLTVQNNNTVTIDTQRRINQVDVKPNGTLIISALNTNSALKVEFNELEADGNVVFQTHIDYPINLYINDSLDLKGELKVEGFGGVNVYIRNQASFQTPNSEVDKESFIMFFLDTGSNVNIQAGSEVRGFFYGPEATVRTHSNKSSIIGGVIASQYVAHNKDEAMGYLIYKPFEVDTGFKVYRVSYWSR